MDRQDGDAERHALRGPIDRSAMLAMRDVVTTVEPLATAGLDDVLDPRSLRVRLDDGLCGADSARIDARWTVEGDYSFHYTDARDIDLRWDRHPHDRDYPRAPGPEDYHPPPDASSDPDDVEASCISQSTERLAVRAVLTLWRAAYHAESLEPLNSLSNPP